MSTSLLFGFSRTLTWAIIARALSGASNGNVGILRTTVAELVPQKSLQPRAFSVMPLVWQIGSILGPILGGALASPATKFPELFGNSDFLKKYPYALPNLVSGLFFTVGIVIGILFLKESLESQRYKRDYGRILGAYLARLCTKRKASLQQTNDYESHHLSPKPRSGRSDVSEKAPRYRDVFSPQANLNLLTYCFLALHSVAFDQLVPVFMHQPVVRPTPENTSLPLKFTGGFGLESGRIGALFTVYGIFSMVLQFTLFPWLTRKMGALFCMRACTLIFPATYLVLPYTVLLPTDATRQAAILAVMLIKGVAGVFAFPCITILLTNSARSLRLLGTLNGVATSLSALFRAAGPFLAGQTFTWGVEVGYVIASWWMLAAFAVLGHIATWWLIEMDGFGAPEEIELDEQEQSLLAEAPAADDASIARQTGSDAVKSHTPPEEDEIESKDESEQLLPTERLPRSASRRDRLDVQTDKEQSRTPSISSRMSSPLGFREPIGPGGERLSNGLGQTMSGLGTGGNTYH